jgi:phosphotriesterase-related protein
MPPEEAGLVSSHEHVLMDMSGGPSPAADPEQEAFAEMAVSIENLGLLRRNTWRLNRDNYRLDDIPTAEEEVRRFGQAGGGTLVDLTTEGLHPRPAQLRDIARSTGVRIVAGCGFYVASMLPAGIREASIARIAELLAAQVFSGLGGSDVRPGIIGELGTSDVVDEVEWRVLRAAAIVQRQSGLAIVVHTYPWSSNGAAIADLLIDEGVDKSRIVIAHLDNAPIDIDEHLSIASRGVYVSYDGFGKEWYVDDLGSWFPRDYERLSGLRQLIDAGYLERLLLGCDVCLKIQLTRYGAWGYEHLPRNVVPMMSAHRFSHDEIEALTVRNPCRLLTVAEPVDPI